LLENPLNQKSGIETNDVRALQRLAQDAAHNKPRQRKKNYSRAALLELIDILSRWSGAGLAIIAGASIIVAVMAGRVYPGRAAAWSAMLICALWVCRRWHSQYRSGAAISAQPFRWRASYTSTLSVLGVVFSAAPILLIPADAAPGFVLPILGAVMVAGLAAAALHAAHVSSAASFALPAILLPFLSTLRAQDAQLLILWAALTALGLGLITSLRMVISRNARRRNPRTSFLRREIDAGAGEDALYERPAQAQTAV